MTLMRADLPEPDGRDHRGPMAWWRLASGELLYATPGGVCRPGDTAGMSLGDIEADALAMLAAVAWARGGTC